MPEISAPLVLDALKIVLIDLLLAGDNAVVIAMAVKTLPPKERKLGILFGAAVAVLLRIVLTFFVAQFLGIPWIKLIGGFLIFWIAVKLLTEAADDEAGVKHATSLWSAVWFILVADITMSTDNIIAVAASSKGNVALLIFGLGLSIPFVVFTSTLLSRIMDRYPIVVWLGAAVLGHVGAELIIGDPVVHDLVHPSPSMEIAAQIAGALAVVAIGKWLAARRAAAM
jgi:YjbE family integral membrane protein